MKRLLVVLATVLIAMPAFSAVLVDWESGFTVGANGSINGSSADPGFDNPLVTLGVDITGDANTLNLQVYSGEPGSPIPFGSNYLLVHTVGNNPGSPSVVTIDFQRRGSTWFAQGNSISIDLWDTNTNPDPRITLVAYDDLGGVAETIGFSPLSGDSGTVTFTTPSLISRIEITDEGGDGYIADNLGFQLQNTAVPEPSTVAMVGGGLLLAGLLRRRR